MAFGYDINTAGNTPSAKGQQVTNRHQKLRILPDLPQYYYHTNFCDMLDFVACRYDHVFDTAHVEFLAAFKALSPSAQCLYVRLAGRKGRVFHTGKLPYPEIADIPRALRELEKTRFIGAVTQDHYSDLLTVMTKVDLTRLLLDHVNTHLFKRSWKKADLIDVAQKHMPFHTTALPPHFIVQGFRAPLRYLTFLYFGKIQDNLQSFTLRDLGLVKVPDFKADYTARFSSKAEAQAAYFYADGLHRFRHGSDMDVAELIDTVCQWPDPECDISENSRDKLLQKLGGLSERLGDIDTALTLYARSDARLCNERVIRLRYARGDKAWCKTRLEALIENPGSDEEHNFAADFYARKFQKKRTSEVTDILRKAEVLRLDQTFRNNPERAAQRHYEGCGDIVFFTENAIWKTLFGLLFWEELFLSDGAGLHSSFERIPTSLRTGQFYNLFTQKIEAKLAGLGETKQLKLTLLKTISRHHGTPNGIFRWSRSGIDKLTLLIDHAPAGALAHMLRLMAKDYRRTKDGFPDLMHVRDDHLSFIEIKAEGDVIRRNQLTRVKQLRMAGFDTRIVRVDWGVDPQQIYVVVDVETTGGRAGLHRVTEIGAVKVQNGKIIDEWQSLINPERPIPAPITRLTNITGDMVKNAPRFADIAEEFAAFMGDAIFAAHNVNFDYSFISAEFQRLGHRFSHAKICTCATMRKLYPGHRSYSLKNLCHDYQIPLNTHHRALCDARAAAELLFLIHDKRLDIAD